LGLTRLTDPSEAGGGNECACDRTKDKSNAAGDLLQGVFFLQETSQSGKELMPAGGCRFQNRDLPLMIPAACVRR